MIFYATTSSERASKGQGGNDYLSTKITIEHNGAKLEIGILRLEYYEDSNVKGYLLALDRSSNLREEAGRVYGEILVTEQKGKKKKGEKAHCGKHDSFRLDCLQCDDAQ